MGTCPGQTHWKSSSSAAKQVSNPPTHGLSSPEMNAPTTSHWSPLKPTGQKHSKSSRPIAMQSPTPHGSLSQAVTCDSHRVPVNPETRTATKTLSVMLKIRSMLLGFYSLPSGQQQKKPSVSVSTGAHVPPLRHDPNKNTNDLDIIMKIETSRLIT